jgi:hypothetical protein
MDCGTTVVGSSCTITDYGNMADIMGAPGATGHFYSYHKERLGWLNNGSSPLITTVETSGTYFIAPFELQDSSSKGLKILKSTDAQGKKTWYYFEFRRPVGFDSFLSYAYSNSNLTSGLLTSLNKETNGQENYQLDMTPETTAWADSALAVGKSYTDSGAGFTITPLSVNSGGATVDVSFGSQPTPTCVMANPLVTANPTAT